MKARLHAAPARDEWDFSACPKGREEFCFNYEYSREAKWIIDEVKLAVSYPRMEQPDGDNNCPRFDRNQNLHLLLADYERDWFLELQLPPGFPTKPYLKTNHQPRELPRPSLDGMFIDCCPTFCEHDEYFKKIGKTDLPWGPTWIKVGINWDRPDKAIAREFQTWLKRYRPEPAKERRGRSQAKQMLADLKALGAFRLLKTMSAREAIDYTIW